MDGKISGGNAGVSSPGQVLELEGEGMPLHGVPSEAGKLLVELEIVMPKMISDAERAFIERNLDS